MNRTFFTVLLVLIAPLALEVSVDQRDTGKKVKLDKTSLDFSLQREIITNILEVSFRAELLSGGKKIWEWRWTENMLPSGHVITVPPDTQDMAKYIHDTMWFRVIEQARVLSLPRHAATTEAGPVWLPGLRMMKASGVSPRLR